MARWDRDWHRRLNQRLVTLPTLPIEQARQVRRALGEDPVAFALIYLRDHLRGRPQRDAEGVERPGKPSFAACHYEWARIALSWREHGALAEPRDDRHAIIAPRETGKSTWWYLILPLWAAAYRHRRFVAAYAHATGQAETHLQTFRKELDENPLLRADFPDLCAPARRQASGQTLADRAGMYHTASGFTFAAKGIDATSLGMKVGNVRPDLIILDDIEPDEAQYTPDLVRKRLGTVRDAILPMNIYATVIIVGTVQIPGSVIHQFVRVAKGEADDEELAWITEERFVPHWHRALVELDDGGVRSLWPEKWPLEFLLSMQGTRTYEKNYDNDPRDGDGSWWRAENVIYDALARAEYDRVVLFIDGAVTNKKQSDYTGLAVVALSVEHRRFYVREAIEVKLVGEDLRDKAVELIELYEINYVMVESNQGGDLWYTVFHDMPIKIDTYVQRERKEVRLRRLLGQYQRAGQPVRHERPLPQYQRRMMAYPHTDHDDVLDAVAAACEHLVWMLLRELGRAPTGAMVQQYSYTGALPAPRGPGARRGVARR